MKFVYLRSLLAVVSLCVLLAAPQVKGATIVEVSGPNDENTNFTVLSNNLMVSFSTAVDYVNVSIEVSLIAFGGDGDWNLSTYLTNQVGPGTTLANELASSSTLISIPGSGFGPPYTITPYTVFSGLDLAAGDYNLILSGTFENTNAWWVAVADPFATAVENDGAAVTRHFAQAGAPDAYLPASGFSDLQGENLWFKVTGDRPLVSDVPEPSTLALFGIGAMAIAAIRRRRASLS